MKRSIVFINIFLFVTVFILVIFAKYYPPSILEVYLSSYYTPDEISELFRGKYRYEYLNIYEILSAEGNANVYTGNLNIILRNHSIEDYGISTDRNTLIAGDKYIDKKNLFKKENTRVKTKLGEYYLRAIIKNNDKAYFCDTEILENNQVRRQRLYLILDDSDNVDRYMNSETMLRLIKSKGIEIATSIAYGDVSNILKKLILIFLFIQLLILFTCMQKMSIFRIKAVIKNYKKLKYDIYLHKYLSDKQNIKFILISIGYIIATFSLLAALIVVFVMIINVRLTFSLNPTSYTSIKNTTMMFVNLFRYFLRYGFTDIAFVIAGIFSTYLLLILLVCKVFMAKFKRCKCHRIY